MVAERSGEVGVLREEPVPGMHTVGAAPVDRVEDRLGVEVALRSAAPAERECLVGHPDVHRVAVELGIDGDSRDAELAACADDPHGDLSTVCDQNLLEHGRQDWHGP